MALEEEKQKAEGNSEEKQKTSIDEGAQDDILDENDPEDALLIKALQRYDDEMLDQLFSQSDDEKPVPLSAKGHEQIQELFSQWLGPEKAKLMLEKEDVAYQNELRRWKNIRRQRRLVRVRRWGSAAAAALFAVILGTLGMQSSLAFKLPEVGFEAIVGSERTRLTAETSEQGGEADGIDVYYTLGKVLDGYELVDDIENEYIKYQVFQNASGEAYIFSQQPSTSDVYANTEIMQGENVNTMYGTAYLYLFDDINSIAWNYQNYTFKIEGVLSKEELLSLLQSLIREV